MKSFIPHFLGGMRLSLLAKTISRHKSDLEKEFWPRLVQIGGASVLASAASILEKTIVRRQIEATALIDDPVFIIGHWRSGTTLLHNLFALDDVQFCTPRTWDVFFPHGSIIGKRSPKLLKYALPKTRVQDGIELAWESPQEEEFALCLLTGLSPYMAIPFPAQEEYYSKFYTFDSATFAERKAWIQAYQYFCKAITLRYENRLVMKSPTNTARIRLLLELYPNAKFVHIKRDPYRVFQSTLHLTRSLFRHFFLQSPRPGQPIHSVLDRYDRLHTEFFAQKGGIPQRQYCEVEFEQFERNPIKGMAMIYSELGLPVSIGYERKLAAVQSDIESYQKNSYRPLSNEMLGLINDRWARHIDALGYELRI